MVEKDLLLDFMVDSFNEFDGYSANQISLKMAVDFIDDWYSDYESGNRKYKKTSGPERSCTAP